MSLIDSKSLLASVVIAFSGFCLKYPFYFVFQPSETGLSRFKFEVNHTCTQSSEFNLRINLDEAVSCQILHQFILIMAPECSNGTVYKRCPLLNGGDTASKCNYRCKCSSTPCHGSLFVHPLILTDTVNVIEMSIYQQSHTPYTLGQKIFLAMQLLFQCHTHEWRMLALKQTIKSLL